MQQRQSDDAAVYDHMWKSMPHHDVLAEGHEVAKSLGLDIVGALGIGDAWALAVLSPKTHLEDGYLQVVIDMLGGAVKFAVISKEPGRSALGACSAEPELETGSDSYEYVHRNVNDITDGKGRRPLLVWPLLKIARPDQRNPHFDLLCRRTTRLSLLMLVEQSHAAHKPEASPHSSQGSDDSEEDVTSHLVAQIDVEDIPSLRLKDFLETPPVGAKVKVNWGRTHGWWSGVVEIFSNGTAKDPAGSGGFVAKGYCIVDYGDGGRHVNLLSYDRHVDDLKKGKDASWCLISIPANALDTVVKRTSAVASGKTVCVGRASWHCGSSSKRVKQTVRTVQQLQMCSPCGEDSVDSLVRCSACKIVSRCLRCLRLPKIKDARDWTCDLCRMLSKEKKKHCWDQRKLLPFEKCLYCEEHLNKSGACICIHCGVSLCEGCACTCIEVLTSIDGVLQYECFVCVGTERFAQKLDKQLGDLSRKLGGKNAKKISNDDRMNADRLGYLFYNTRMACFYAQVTSTMPSMLTVLQIQSAANYKDVPSLMPSQFMSIMGQDGQDNFALYRGICKANFKKAASDAKIIEKRARARLKALPSIPKLGERITVGCITCDAGSHPLWDMCYGLFLSMINDPRVKFVLIVVGAADRRYERVSDVYDKIKSSRSAELLELVVASIDNMVDALIAIRERQIHYLIDYIGLCNGAQQALMAAQPALWVLHHLNFPGPQYMDYGWMVADHCTWPPGIGQARLDGAEPCCYLTSWMLPLTSERVGSGHIDMHSTRQQWGLDPDRLYWIFDARLSKLDPYSLDLFLAALKRAPKHVSLWFLGSPPLAEANVSNYLRHKDRWSIDLEGRVIFGPHLPKDDHLSRLAAFANGGGALFLNTRGSWSAHTTFQEGIAMGAIPIVLLDKTSAFQGRAGAIMNMQLGLGSLVASTPENFETLLLAWSQDDKREERGRLSREFQQDFINQRGFWDQDRPKDELVHAFMKIAEKGGALEPVDGRIDRYKPPDDRYPEQAAWKPLARVGEPHMEMELVYAKIKDRFEAPQLPHVRNILCWAIEKGLRPQTVLGAGGHCLALFCSLIDGLDQVLRIEFRSRYASAAGNLHNSELARTVFTESEVIKRLPRDPFIRTASVLPKAHGELSFALGQTTPGADQVTVMFSVREYIPHSLDDILKKSRKNFWENGVVDELFRIVFQILFAAISRLNAKMVFLMDASPSNIFLTNIDAFYAGAEGAKRPLVILPDLGGSAVFPFQDETGNHVPLPSLRANTSPAESREKVKPNRRNESSKLKFNTASDVAKIFNRKAEKQEYLKRARPGTPPFRYTGVEKETFTAEVAAFIDRWALVRILLWTLVPPRHPETVEKWDEEAKEAARSTDGMGDFIRKRMQEHLRKDHPRQPLMWSRFLPFLTRGLRPWGGDTVDLKDLVMDPWASLPFLDASDDLDLATGGKFVVAPRRMYGKDVHDKFAGRFSKQTLIMYGGAAVGLEVFADDDMVRGDIAGIYIACCVPKGETYIESRFTIANHADGTNFRYVTVFNSKMNVKWYACTKNASGPCMNAAWDTGDIENCTLERTMGWFDDQDTYQGHALKIFPITVSVDKVKKGDKLRWHYDPHAGLGHAFSS